MEMQLPPHMFDPATMDAPPERHCRGCGRLLPVHSGPGRPREWHSDACRKRTERKREELRELAAAGFRLPDAG
jgi:hypothetical protein